MSARHQKLRLQEYLPYRLSVAANAVSRVIARAYESEFGLTIPQWRLIAVLAEQQPLTPQELCEWTIMDKVAVTRAAQSLLRRGLIERMANSSDGRSHRVQLSTAGMRLHAKVAPRALQYEAELLAGFDAAAITRLRTQLQRLQHTASSLSANRTVRAPSV